MDFDTFTGTVQHRLELPGTGETVRAVRATLLTLGQRIPAGGAEDLAASLPMEIKWYLTGGVETHSQRFDWHEFVDRVAAIDGGVSRTGHRRPGGHARPGVGLPAAPRPAPRERGRRELAEAVRRRRRGRVGGDARRHGRLSGGGRTHQRVSGSDSR